MSIHPTAVVDSTAELAPDVVVGPYCVIGRSVVIGRGTRLSSHVVVEPFTSLGEDCDVRQGTVLGGTPQDFKFRGERSHLIIGNRNYSSWSLRGWLATTQTRTTIWCAAIGVRNGAMPSIYGGAMPCSKGSSTGRPPGLSSRSWRQRSGKPL